MSIPGYVSDNRKHQPAGCHQELLKKKADHTYLKKNIGTLRDVLRFHEYRYYIMNDPLISDHEYDHLYQALEKPEEAHPNFITRRFPHTAGSHGA